MEGLFAKHPFLHKVITWDKSEKKYLKLLDVLNIIREERYDLLVNLQRFASTGFLTILSRAKNTIGFSKNPFSLFFSKRVKHAIGSLHETERNHKLIETLTDTNVAKVSIYPSHKDFAFVSQYKTHAYICIAPASLWFTKQFPEDSWTHFTNEAAEDLHIYLLGSKADNALCQRIAAKSRHQNILNLAGKLSLLQTTALMRDARMNFVNDSAPQHLASAVNAPVCAIFCSTVPEFGFGPLSDKAHIIQTEMDLNCKPCGLHGKSTCPEKHFKCAKTIKTSQLLFYL